jgi:diguanylate cyclase (GGDEF)-like protein
MLAWLVVGVAVWQTATLFPSLDLDLTRQYLVLAALAGTCELVAAPLANGRLSTGFAVVLAARLIYGPAPAVWIWALATLAGQGIANRGNPLRTTIFNAAQAILAAVAAARLLPGTGGLLRQSLVFTLGYYLAGAILLAVFSPPRRSRVRSSLGGALSWDLFTYLVTWPFGLGMAMIYRASGLSGVVLLFLPLLAASMVLRRLVGASGAAHELAVWHDLSARSAAAWEPAKAFRLVLAAAARLVPCQSAVLFLWSEAENCFTAQASVSGSKSGLSGVKLFREQALPALLSRERRPVLVNDSRIELAGDAGPAQFWRSLALFPLLVGDDLAGILVLGEKKPGAFTVKHQESILPAVALATRMAAAALLERRLREVSVIDAVTGLYNRRYFVLRTYEEGERANRFGTEFAVAVLALDSLAEVGEHFGHGGAENLLVAVADLLARAVRPVDLAARYGERELAVLMPETGLKEAGELVENLVQTFRAREFPLEGGSSVQPAFRAAWGVYPRQAEDVAALFRRVDHLLARSGDHGAGGP